MDGAGIATQRPQPHFCVCSGGAAVPNPDPTPTHRMDRVWAGWPPKEPYVAAGAHLPRRTA